MSFLRIGLACVSVGFIAIACGGISDGGSAPGQGAGGQGGASGEGGTSGEGGAGDEGGGGPLSEEDFLDSLSDTLCDIQDCCDQRGYAYDLDGCKAHYAKDLARSLGAGPGYAYQADAAGKCLEQAKGLVDTCGREPVPLDCVRVYAGGAGPGAPCSIDSDCASAGNGTALCTEQRTCRQIPRGGVGDECTDSAQEKDGHVVLNFDAEERLADCFREDGVHCDQDAGYCVPLSRRGEGCYNSLECEFGSYCESARCVALLTAGQRCYSSDNCVAGLYCSEQSGVCEQALELGAACEEWESCGQGAFCNGGHCEMWGFPDTLDCRGDGA